MTTDLPVARDPDEAEDFDDLPSGDGVVVISSGGMVLSANPQAERLLKRRLPHGYQFDIRKEVLEQYVPRAQSVLKDVLENGHTHTNLVARLSMHSGLPVSLIFSISPLYDAMKQIVGAVLTFQDNAPDLTSPEGGKEPRLIAYENLFEQLAEGVFTINNRWRITSFNQRAQEITGFSREEVLGRHCWDIFKSSLCQSDCPLKITMETGVFCMDQDVRILIKGGHQQSILVNTSVIKNKKGLVVGAVETFRPLSLGDRQLDGVLTTNSGDGEIVGQSKGLVKILNLLPDIAASDATVLIEGESGTGKELIAKAIHRQSPRSQGPFVAVNCSALAETLLESELFGHVKGAFTGAANSRVGRFELARGGTLFLDEIAEIKPEIQVKLLRVIEEGAFERVGGNRSITMDARIIAATNKNLSQEVRQGRFREDLFYRVRTVPLYLPPLKERPTDIPLLVNHFMDKFNRKYDKEVRGIDPKVLDIFNRYAWPGNIRELARVLEYAFVFVKGPIITPSHLPDMKDAAPLPDGREQQAASGAYLWADEKVAIENMLQRTRGRRSEAAHRLGISRTSLWRKMKAHGLI